MQDTQSLNRRYETIAWGAFFILLGATSLLHWLPEGVGTVGVGVIFLGLNLARYLSKIPTSGFTITLGVIAVVLGGADMARTVFNLQVEVPVFPLLLIAIGIILLARAMLRSAKG